MAGNNNEDHVVGVFLSYNFIICTLCLYEVKEYLLEMLFVEDIDPSVGRFRNLVQTTVIPKKVHVTNRV